MDLREVINVTRESVDRGAFFPILWRNSIKNIDKCISITHKRVCIVDHPLT